jgi:Flp pilus assembly protein CpaB
MPAGGPPRVGPVRRGHPAPGRLALGSTPPWWRGRRSRWLRWTSALVLAATAAALAASVTSRAEHTLAAYADRRRVPVASHDLAVGATLGPADISWRDLPPAAVPDDVVVGSPVGRTVIDRMARGEVIGRLRVAPDGLSHLAAQLVAGQRAMAIPTRAGGLHLEVGDRVDVVAPARDGSDLDGTDRDPAEVVARGASVLALDDGGVVVAVSDHDAPAVADALAQGTPVLALLGAR